MLTKKKKIIVLTSMLVLLVITGVLNVLLNSSSNVSTTASAGYEYSTSSFFTTSRQDRTSTRNESIEYYNQILQSSSASSEAKQNAESSINSIISAMSIETTMEGLIKAKGFSEALVNYSSTYINVILQSASLTESEVAQIVEIIKSQVDRDKDYIKIIPVE